jgi:hypothetical protein
MEVTATTRITDTDAGAAVSALAGDLVLDSAGV